MDLTGQRYGRLTVVEQAKTHVTPGGRNVYMWRCVCDCGNEVIVDTNSLKSGNTTACGCRQSLGWGAEQNAWDEQNKDLQ